MPTLKMACLYIARIFDPSQPLNIFYDDLQTLALTLLSLTLLVIKDVRDEFFPDRLPLMNSRHIAVRWATYVLLMLTILLMGAFGGEQFIYANF